MLSTQAHTVIAYLKGKGFNSARETAHECGLDEVALDAVLEEIDTTGSHIVHKGIRRESYGHEVIWIERAS